MIQALFTVLFLISSFLLFLSTNGPVKKNRISYSTASFLFTMSIMSMINMSMIKPELYSAGKYNQELVKTEDGFKLNTGYKEEIIFVADCDEPEVYIGFYKGIFNTKLNSVFFLDCDGKMIKQKF